MIDDNLTAKSAEFIYKGLNTKQAPGRDKDYKQLIAYWESNSEFREITRIIAKGLRLKITDVSYQSGLILSPDDYYSLFSFGGLTELKKSLTGHTKDSVVQRATVILTVIAILAAFFRDEEQIFSYNSQIESKTLIQIVTLLKEACKSFKANIKDDRESTMSYLREGWEEILNLPDVSDSKIDINNIEGLIKMITRRFVEEGLLIQDKKAEELSWFPTQRFISQVENETSNELYEYYKSIASD